MNSIVKGVINTLAGAALSCYFSELISDKIIDIASDGLVFEKKGLLGTRYENMAGKKVTKKVAKYKKVIDPEFTQDDIRDTLNRLGSITGTSLGIGTVVGANVLIDKVVGNNEDCEMVPFEVVDDEDEDDD